MKLGTNPDTCALSQIVYIDKILFNSHKSSFPDCVNIFSPDDVYADGPLTIAPKK